ncbi:HAD family hydrolase [Rhodoligotrophos defluvii]|uniref:HAD family hydrolase n=1 Tax=Rhodoligotrophos defluvii TaxID=2561934 RepID=UPI001EF10E6A|nr:HAD family hydrolase [Rhodoligotrophos defluvii]
MTDLVIFDCDGVLVDSEVIAARVIAENLADLGIVVDPEYVLTGFIGLDAAGTRRRIEADHGIVLAPEFDVEGGERLAHAFRTELQPVAGILALLQNLDRPFCVASNSGHERLAQSFAATGLSEFLRGRVFSADDVARGKPAPDLFLHAARQMGNVAPSRCLVIEDSSTGVQAARAAGMRVIGFCGGGHIRPGHAERLLAGGAEQIVASHAELAIVLASLHDEPARAVG